MRSAGPVRTPLTHILSSVLVWVLRWSFILSTLAVCSFAQDRRYRDLTIPSGLGVVFPTPERVLTQVRDQQDVPAMRKHAWAVFSGLVQPAVAGESDGEAVWETWYSKREMDAGCRREKYHRIRELKLPLEIVAGYVLQDDETHRAASEPGPMASAVEFFSNVHSPRAQVLYNAHACRHIHALRLTDPQSLDKRNRSYDKSGAPPRKRDIPEFPAKSVVVKNVWQVVTPGDQELDLWEPSADPKALFRVRVTPAKVGESCNLSSGHKFPVLTSCFYNIPVTEENYEEIREAEGQGMPTAYPGCVLILVGLHVITKEISDWTWTTFWWSLKPDRPPYGADRPGPPFIPAPWRNYVMDTTLSMVTPVEEDPLVKSAPNAACQQSVHALEESPRAKICFNPYLERMPNGSSSNCMNCHRQATFHRLDPDPTSTVLRGYLGPDATCFADRLKVDYLWSLSPPEAQSKLFQFERNLRNIMKDTQSRSPNPR